MNLESLGELTPDKSIPEWLVSHPINVSYFSQLALRFILHDLEDDERPEEFGEAVQNFLSLTTLDRDLASIHVFRTYSHFVDLVEPEDVAVKINRPEDVWQHVYPSEIHVSRRHRRDKKVYVSIDAECDWEPEHGLQIVYREGKVLSRVSDQDGHLSHADAYGLPESEDRIS
jgi:hypothetical protein